MDSRGNYKVRTYPNYLEMQDSERRETAIFKALNVENSYSI